MTPTPEQLLAVAKPQSAASMRQALEWTAAALQSLTNGGLSEDSTLTTGGVTKTFGQILDEANVALDTPPAPAEPQGEDIPVLCPRCDGSGDETVFSDSSPDAHDVTIECTHCMGHGGLLDAYKGVVETLKRVRIAHLRATGERLLAAPAPQQPAQQQDARDGARYRWMMSGAIVPMAGRDKPRIRSVMYGDGSGDKIAQVHAWGEQELIDAAIDAAMQQQGGGNG